MLAKYHHMLWIICYNSEPNTSHFDCAVLGYACATTCTMFLNSVLLKNTKKNVSTVLIESPTVLVSRQHIKWHGNLRLSN